MYEVFIHLTEFQIKLSGKSRNRIYTHRGVYFGLFVCLFVCFTGVDMFAHLDMLISKIITVKDFVRRFYGSLPYLEKEVDLRQLSS